MSPAFVSALVVLMLGIAYLRLGRSVAIKRWALPLTTAGLAALLGLTFASSGGGDLIGYAMGVPLGLSIGLLLQVIFDYCRGCGATRSLRTNLGRAFAHHGNSGHCPTCNVKLPAR